MADAGLNAIEKGLRAALAANSTLVALVPAARHWNMLLPPESTFPAVVIQLMSSDFEGRGFGQEAQALEYMVKGITRGGVSAVDQVAVSGDIAQQIDLALHNAVLTATGYTPYGCKRQRWVRYTESDEGRVPYVHSGAVYRVWVQG